MAIACLDGSAPAKTPEPASLHFQTKGFVFKLFKPDTYHKALTTFSDCRMKDFWGGINCKSICNACGCCRKYVLVQPGKCDVTH